jgi:hypothetical protein
MFAYLMAISASGMQHSKAGDSAGGLPVTGIAVYVSMSQTYAPPKHPKTWHALDDETRT